MFLPPTFITLPWNYPPFHQLLGRITIISNHILHRELYLEPEIHGRLLQLLPPGTPFISPLHGHHVVIFLLC